MPREKYTHFWDSLSFYKKCSKLAVPIGVLFGAFFFTYIGWHIGKGSKDETEQRLAKAKELLDRKVVTEDEYISIRRKIILDS